MAGARLIMLFHIIPNITKQTPKLYKYTKTNNELKIYCIHKLVTIGLFLDSSDCFTKCQIRLKYSDF